MASAPLPTRLRRSDRDRVMVTPEGISLPLTIASRGTRAGALMIDFLFIGILMFATTMVLIYIAGGTLNLMTRAEDAGAVGRALQFLFIVWIAAMFLFRNAYFLFFELGPRGATPGKRITGIRIASRDGGRLTAEMVIARNLLRDIELFLPFVFVANASDGGDMGAAGIAATAWFLIFALFPLFNSDRMRAGDMIAGTWVIEVPKVRLQAAMSVGKARKGGEEPLPASAITFSDAELVVYGEYELQTLERVLREGRPEAIDPVYEAICRKIGRPPEPAGRRAFLEAYYRQLRGRLEAGMRMGRRKADKYSI